MHLHLSPSNDKILVGNFMADSIKGNQLMNYEIAIQKGIKLHRFIDSYSDSHIEVLKSKKLFRKEYEKYSGVVVDIVFDHLLAKNWNQFSSIPLKQFTRDAYLTLLQNFLILPVKVKKFLPFMIVDDWLSQYQDLIYIEDVLKRMNQRTSLPYKSMLVYSIVQENYLELEKSFSTFYIEIKSAIEIEGLSC